MNRKTLVRTAHLGESPSGAGSVLRPVRNLGTGLLFLALGLSAAAKDEPHVGATFNPETQASPDTQIGTPADSAIFSKSKTWHQTGIASWYGRHFHERLTANGEHYDMNSMTCAHPSLPMGTWLRVTNLKNQRAAFVRVNDRGPFLRGRIVDLSFAAARMLHIEGVSKVRLDAVHSGDQELAQALVNERSMPVFFALAN